MKFAICNEVYVGCSAEYAIGHVAKLGYDGIELAPFTLAEDVASLPELKQREIAECAEDHGIEVVGLHWLLSKPEGLHVTTPDAAVRSRTRDFFRKLIEIGANTGGRVLTLGSPGQRSFAQGESHETAAERAVEFFRALAPELEAAGQVLALEPLEPEYTNFMTRTAQACDIARRIGSKAVGVTLDTHFVRWEIAEFGGSCLDTFRLAGPLIAHMHIQDDNLLAPGTGQVDFSDYKEALRTFGWDGYISVEPLFVKEEGLGERIAAESMAFFKRHFPREE